MLAMDIMASVLDGWEAMIVWYGDGLLIAVEWLSYVEESKACSFPTIAHGRNGRRGILVAQILAISIELDRCYR